MPGMIAPRYQVAARRQNAAIIAAPGSTKIKDGACDSAMHQTKKGNAWHFPAAGDRGMGKRDDAQDLLTAA